MENLHRAASLLLLIMAAAVGVHYIITPLYDDGSTGFPVWSALNWPMAVAVAAAFAITLAFWLPRAGHSVQSIGTNQWLQTNFRFYSSLVLLLWFLNNWFADILSLDAAMEWGLVNALFVVVMLSTGLRPWQRQREG